MSDDDGRALAVIRQSQSDRDESASLLHQRQVAPRVARRLAGAWERVDVLDLGVHTGFSIHTRDASEERIDANADVEAAIDRLEAGVYDYVTAVDDTRLARDDYFSAWKHAAALGDADLVFPDEGIDVGSLEHDLKRSVEKHAKQKEIRQAKSTVRDRENAGKWNTRVPTGLRWDSDHDYLLPGEGYYACLEVLAARDSGESWRAIEDRTGIPYSTARRIYEHRDRYEVFVDCAGGVVEDSRRFARVA